MDSAQITILVASILTLAGIGFLAGFGLAYASHKFHVAVDPQVEKILGLLPGSNCGVCGYPSCQAAAEAVVSGAAEANVCKPGGEATCHAICNLLGAAPIAAQGKLLAAIHCGAGPEVCEHHLIYQGEQTCAAAQATAGGFLSCDAGCLGFGDCLKACPFNAIQHEKGELPKITRQKCTGCGKCVPACPRSIIKLHPAKQKVFVLCSTRDKGAAVKKYCKVGCIGCRSCVSQCPTQAITMGGSIPEIDPDKCEVREVCIQKCPPQTIKKL